MTDIKLDNLEMSTKPITDFYEVPSKELQKRLLDDAWRDIVSQFEIDCRVMKIRHDSHDSPLTPDGKEAETDALHASYIERFRTLEDDMAKTGDSPKYTIIFRDILQLLYEQQEAAEVNVSYFNDKVRRRNEHRGLPKQQWESFDASFFTQQVKNLGILNMLDSLVDVFGMAHHKDAILKNAIDNMSTSRRKKG